MEMEALAAEAAEAERLAKARAEAEAQAAQEAAQEQSQEEREPADIGFERVGLIRVHGFLIILS
jgi:predicted cobalt transporter CbtA